MKETKKEYENIDSKDVNANNEKCENQCGCETATEPTDNVADDATETVDNEALLAGAVKEWQDKYMRLSAEFDNYRKRTLKEKMELLDSASEGVVKAILPVVDDFDRAADAMAKSSDVDSLRSGVELIQKRLMDVLKQQGVVAMESIGEELNTDFHDAIAKFPVEDETKKGKVIDVVEKGYLMKDRVVRFAKVVVGE